MIDSIVEFVGLVFKKGEKYSCNDFDEDYLWEEIWEDNCESVEPEKDCNGFVYDDNLVKFTKNCFAVKMDSIINPSSFHHQSGLECEIEVVGFMDVFENWKDDIIKLCKDKLKKENELRINPDHIGIKPDPPTDFIRVFTAWLYTSIPPFGYYETEFELLGTVNLNSLEIIKNEK